MKISKDIKLEQPWVYDSSSQFLIRKSTQSQSIEFLSFQENMNLVIYRTITLTFNPDMIEIFQDNELLLVCSKKNKLIQIYSYKGIKISSFLTEETFTRCVWGPRGDNVFVVNEVEMLRYNLEGQIIQDFQLPKSSDDISRHVVASPNGRLLAVCTKRIEKNGQSKQTIYIYCLMERKLINDYGLKGITDCQRIKWLDEDNIIVWNGLLEYILTRISVFSNQQLHYKPNQIIGIHDIVHFNKNLLIMQESNLRIISQKKFIAQTKLQPPSHISKQIISSTACYKQTQKLFQDQPVIQIQEFTQSIILLKENREFREKNMKKQKKDIKNIAKVSTTKGIKYIACKYKSFPNIIWIYDSSLFKLVSMIKMNQQITQFQWSPFQIILCFYTSKCINFWSPQNTIPIDLKHFKPTDEQFSSSSQQVQFKNIIPQCMKWISSNRILLSTLSKGISKINVFQMQQQMKQLLLFQ